MPEKTPQQQPEVQYVPWKDRMTQQRTDFFAKPRHISESLSYIPKAKRVDYGSLFDRLLSSTVSATNQKAMAAAPAMAPQPAPTPKSSELHPIVFGEVSNRPTEKKELEARVILTTALNRQRAYKERGIDKTLDEILTMPNQYQAYKGKQYNLYREGTTTELDTGKKKEVDAIVAKLLQELEEGRFKPLSERAYYYIHNPDGTITYDDTRPLFK